MSYFRYCHIVILHSFSEFLGSYSTGSNHKKTNGEMDSGDDHGVGPDQEIGLYGDNDNNSEDQIPETEEKNKEETIVRKLDDDEQIPSEGQRENGLVTLLESSDFPVLTRPDACMMCMTCKGRLCLTNKACAYFHLLTNITNHAEVGGQFNITANHTIPSVDPVISNITEGQESVSTFTKDSQPEHSKDNRVDKTASNGSEQGPPTSIEIPQEPSTSTTVKERMPEKQPASNEASEQLISTPTDSLSQSEDLDSITSMKTHDPITLQPSHTVEEPAASGEITPVLSTVEEASSDQSVVESASQTSTEKPAETIERVNLFSLLAVVSQVNSCL